MSHSSFLASPASSAMEDLILGSTPKIRDFSTSAASTTADFHTAPVHPAVYSTTAPPRGIKVKRIGISKHSSSPTSFFRADFPDPAYEKHDTPPPTTQGCRKVMRATKQLEDVAARLRTAGPTRFGRRYCPTPFGVLDEVLGVLTGGMGMFSRTSGSDVVSKR
ncbi:unnamed protein product [Amoebophrya sp. A25]|nr:unnamed protein product [Amoebophrya sp. A25]|eukprot:GSA25T00025894001.1